MFEKTELLKGNVDTSEWNHTQIHLTRTDTHAQQRNNGPTNCGEERIDKLLNAFERKDEKEKKNVGS